MLIEATVAVQPSNEWSKAKAMNEQIQTLLYQAITLLQNNNNITDGLGDIINQMSDLETSVER